MTTPPTLPPKVVLNEGVTRAKNMAVAFGMIVYLLARFVAVKIIWKRCERLIAFVVVKLAVWLSTLYNYVLPHWERVKVYARETRIKAFRLILGLLITLVTPIENTMVKGFAVAKVRSEHMAVVTVTSMIQVMTPFFNALGQAFKLGFSKPAIQRLLNRLFEILEEAQK